MGRKNKRQRVVMESSFDTSTEVRRFFLSIVFNHYCFQAGPHLQAECDGLKAQITQLKQELAMERQKSVAFERELILERQKSAAFERELTKIRLINDPALQQKSSTPSDPTKSDEKELEKSLETLDISTEHQPDHEPEAQPIYTVVDESTGNSLSADYDDPTGGFIRIKNSSKKGILLASYRVKQTVDTDTRYVTFVGKRGGNHMLKPGATLSVSFGNLNHEYFDDFRCFRPTAKKLKS